jgi:undecaprenyl-diphosphatase
MLVTTLTCMGSAVADEEPTTATETEETRPRLSLFQALVLGVIEGATEYLPVSSTGHLLIAEHLMGMDADERQKEAADSLAICIQSGAILAVVMLYFGRIRQIVTGMLGKSPEGLKLLINLVIAFFPAAVLALVLKDWVKQHLFGVMPVAAAQFVGGLIIIGYGVMTRKSSPDEGKEISDMSSGDALLIGSLQCLAFWPGFSRSLATILGCRFAKLKMMASVEFSFLLGLVKDMIADYGLAMPLVSLVTAFVAAVLSVRFMVGALGKFGLTPFGYYRILLAIACVLWLQH